MLYEAISLTPYHRLKLLVLFMCKCLFIEDNAAKHTSRPENLNCWSGQTTARGTQKASISETARLQTAT